MTFSAPKSNELARGSRMRRTNRIREITSNVLQYMLDQYIWWRIQRADAEIAAAHADADDVRVARERLLSAKTEGTVSWESIKKDMGL